MNDKDLLNQRLDLEEVTVAELIRRMHTDLGEFKSEISGIKELLASFTRQFDKVDMRVDNTNESVRNMEKRVEMLEKEQKYLDQRVDTFEKMIESRKLMIQFEKDVYKERKERRAFFISNMIATVAVLAALVTWALTTFVFK